MKKKPYPKVHMVCAICHRPMARAAALQGGYQVGPKCAVKAGLVDPKTPRSDGVTRDTKTIDLFA